MVPPAVECGSRHKSWAHSSGGGAMAEEKLVPGKAALAARPDSVNTRTAANKPGAQKEAGMATAAATVPISIEQETNPWEAQAARFDLAASKMNLDPGLWKVLKS